MATISKLVTDGAIFKIDPALGPGVQGFRAAFASHRLRTWILETLPSMGSTWNLELLPIEQLDALLNVYASGQVLTYGWHFKCLNPVGDGVWELKTADLRVFGWFPLKDHFIGAVADSSERVKTHGLYWGYRNETVQFRTGLDLDEPKFIPGDNPDDVVSNYTDP